MPASAATETHEDLLELMLDLGIYNTEDQMELGNETVIRGEMASVLSVFYGVTDLSYTVETNFKDVPANWVSGHIMTLVDNGIMNGYTDGLFRPDAAVTLEQVVKIFVSMTGYDMMAEIHGGFPNGYFRVAAEKGILDNISTTDKSRTITKAEFTRLLYNAMKGDILQMITVGDPAQYTINKGENLLSENLDIYTFEGRLEALPYVALGYADTALSGRVRISGINYDCAFDAYPYFGLEVKGYYRQADDDVIGTVLTMEERREGEGYITIAADDIVSVTTDFVSTTTFLATIKDE